MAVLTAEETDGDDGFRWDALSPRSLAMIDAAEKTSSAVRAYPQSPLRMVTPTGSDLLDEALLWEDISPTALAILQVAEENADMPHENLHRLLSDRRDELEGSFDIVKGLKPLSSKWEKGWLSVTDFASLKWCEHQVYYHVTTGRKKPTSEAMKKGTAIHAKLEEEVTDVVEVKTETKEDRWAVTFLNMIITLDTLMAK
ncbi:hypothetical protein HK101_003972, partial [Irineochytrium annulatum]